MTATGAPLPARASHAEPPEAAEGDGRSEHGPPDQPWSWHLSRASALLLVVLVPLHFAVTFIIDDVGATTARSMSDRLADPTWRLLTWLTIALALVHAALSSVRTLRARRPGAVGDVATALVGVLAGGLVAGATWVLFVNGT